MAVDMIAHLTRQIAFSRATFGPDSRMAGVIDHIRKELVEVELADTDDDRIKEWTDVVILALDGLTRAIASQIPYGHAEVVAEEAVDHIVAKQGRNEMRNWPDWRTAPEGKAIEHVRGTHD